MYSSIIILYVDVIMIDEWLMLRMHRYYLMGREISNITRYLSIQNEEDQNSC